MKDPTREPIASPGFVEATVAKRLQKRRGMAEDEANRLAATVVKRFAEWKDGVVRGTWD